MKISNVFLMIILSSSLSWTSISNGREVPNGNMSLEFKRINFPENRPGKNESYIDIDFVLDEKQRAALRDFASILIGNPTIGVRVVGFADKCECQAMECGELSLRRAKFVFDWLLENGVAARQLKGPDGESTYYPLDDGDTEQGKALNRRVQLEPHTVSEEKS